MEPPDAVSDVAQTESSAQPRPRAPRPAAAEEERIRVRRETLAVVLERCRKALELLENADLDVDTSSVRSSDGEDDDRREKGEVDDPREEGEVDDPAVPLTPDGSSPPKPPAGDSETDELCALLKSKVESPTFLEKLGNIDISVYPKYHADDNLSWDLVSASELWEDKLDDQNNSDEDGYVLVGQEDVVDGIAAFMAAYLLSLNQAKELTPNQLQEALGKAFSTKKKKSRLRKVWEGSQVIYNVASWGATAVGIYQNPMILKAATVAFWSSCRVLSKLL